MSTSTMMPTTLALFNTAVNAMRDILRKEGITGMDSMKHCSLYILARALDKKECERLKISLEYSWDKFKDLMIIDSKRQECFDLLYNKNGNDLISYLDDIFGTRNFNFKLKNPDNHIAILKILNNVNLKELEGKVDILGTVYENHLGSGSNKSAMRDLGQFFTDRRVCKYMTELCNPQYLGDGLVESVLDPTMGTAGFLTSYANKFKDDNISVNWSNMQMDVAGYDIDEFVMSVGRINMYLSTGIIFDRIAHRDTLHHDIGELHQRLKFKVILANMPFGVKGLKFADCCARVKDLKCDGTKSEPLFLNLMMAALDDGGRCAVVVPDGVLVNNSKQHNATRKYLLENFELKRVIKMKGQFFSNTGIQPSILFFENTGEETETIEFWEVEQDAGGNVVEKKIATVASSNLDESCSLDVRRYQENVAVGNTGGYPMVKLGEYIEDLRTGRNNANLLPGDYPFYMSNGISQYANTYQFDGEYVLTGRCGSLNGSQYYVNGKFSASDFTYVIKTKEPLLAKYLYYLLKMTDWTQWQTGTTMKGIRRDVISDYNIRLPPLHIQQEIASALDNIYNTAATAKAAADSVKVQMAAVVKSVGQRGYEKKKLGDVCSLNPENITKSDKDYPIQYIDLGSVKEGILYQTQDFTYSTKPSRAQRKVIANDILWGSVRPLSRSYTFLESPAENTIASTGFVVIRNKDNTKLFPRFLYYMSIADEAVEYLNSRATGSNYPAFSAETLGNYTIPIPPLAVQEEVLTKLNEMEAERKTLEQMAAKAEERAKFILNNYLTPVQQETPEEEELVF